MVPSGRPSRASRSMAPFPAPWTFRSSWWATRTGNGRPKAIHQHVHLASPSSTAHHSPRRRAAISLWISLPARGAWVPMRCPSGHWWWWWCSLGSKMDFAAPSSSIGGRMSRHVVAPASTPFRWRVLACCGQACGIEHPERKQAPGAIIRGAIGASDGRSGGFFGFLG